MDRDFWLQRWSNGQIGFHEGVPNKLLLRHFSSLELADGNHVFMPLCGKTVDIAWMLAKGMKVTGAELSKQAIDELFEELDIKPSIDTHGQLEIYSAENITIYVGDLFEIDEESLGKVDAIYDRAALVALPPDMRKSYAAKLMRLTKSAPQLLICFEYDQTEMNGPPFSIEEREIRNHYDAAYDITLLERIDDSRGLKRVDATEAAWLLRLHTT